METRPATVSLPPIPAKRYFTIGEVSDLCAVKPHVLRYWEQEFSQLRPMKRRGNRRYFQHHEVLLIRRIRELLYDQGFTISGARNQLMDSRLGNGAAGSPLVEQPSWQRDDGHGYAGELPTLSAAPNGQVTLRAALEEILGILKEGPPQL